MSADGTLSRFYLRHRRLSAAEERSFGFKAKGIIGHR
jgi:hypothetical protein